jgi:electron transfer flavoprotein alpha subunit
VERPLRIVVCVKQVPEVSELSLDPVTRRLRRDGVPLQINPFDRRAVLEATRLRAEHGGSITVLSMGPPQTEAALRECLSLGVDRAVHLCDPAFAGADTLATARALARALERLGYDLVLGGRFSIDSETGQVCPEIAALLDVPLLSGVRQLAIAADPDGGLTARAECERDGGCVDVTCALPLLATCTDRWKTRVPLVMPDDEASQRGTVEIWGHAALGGAADDYGQAGSPTWVADAYPVELSRRREILVARDDLDAAVDAFLAELASLRASGDRSSRAVLPTHVKHPDPRGAIWVLAETSAEGRLRVVTAELLGVADRLATELGAGVCAFVLTPELAPADAPRCGPDALAAELGAVGADVLLCPDPAAVRSEEGAARVLEAAIREHRPRIVLAPATGLGRDLVPRVAARLGIGLTGDAIGVELDRDGRLRQLKPAFGGQLVAPILSRTLPEMVTLRPGVLHAVRPAPEREAATIVRLQPTAGVPSARMRILAWTAEVDDGGALDASPVVVCIGHGMGKDAVPLATDLAAALGGVVAATRRVCDVGWVPRQLQVGISGRSVAPDLYVALGVRGSFNHMVGMQRAGRVIAVNRDADAEIFAGSDLGIVGDGPAFAAALLARLRSGL